MAVCLYPSVLWADTVGQWLDRVEKRLGEVEVRLNAIEQRLSVVEIQIQELDKRLTNQIQELDKRVSTQFEGLSSELGMMKWMLMLLIAIGLIPIVVRASISVKEKDWGKEIEGLKEQIKVRTASPPSVKKEIDELKEQIKIMREMIPAKR